MSKYDFVRTEYLELFNETLESAGGFADLPAERFQTRSILNLVANQTIDYAISSNNDDVRDLLFDAFYFVREMQDALVPNIVRGNLKWLPKHERDNPQFNERIWKHKDCRLAIYSEESGHYWPLDPEELMRLCTEYLRQPWIHCGIIDRILVDAVIYREVLGTGNFLKPIFLSRGFVFGYLEDDNYKRTYQMLPKFSFWNLVVNFVAISAIGIIGFSIIERYGIGVGAFAGVCLLALYKIIQAKNRQDNFDGIKRHHEILAMMLAMSVMTDENPLSPKHLRERLRKAENLGAVWPVGIFPILDNAIARNSLTWD